MKNIATRHRYENGLTLIVRENHFNSTVAINGYLKTGSIADGPENRGTSDFVAQMLTKGTSKRNWEMIAEEMESVGANLNFWSNTETTGIKGRFLSADLQRMLNLLSEILREPSFTEKEIEKHRKQVKSWLEAWEDETDRVAAQALSKAIYPYEHPYHHRVQGTKESISTIDRQVLRAFHRKNYLPSALILVVVGDVETKSVIEQVGETFGTWTSELDHRPIEITKVALYPRKIEIKNMPDKSQVDLAIGHRGIARTDANYEVFNLINLILGGSAGIARLFDRVRDQQGLAYSIWSSFSPTFGEGPFRITAGTAPKNLSRAIISIFHELKILKENGVTIEELNDSKNLMVGNFTLALETNGGLASVLATSELYALGLDYLERYETIYRAITQEQIHSVLEKFLSPENCSIAIAGTIDEDSVRNELADNL